MKEYISMRDNFGGNIVGVGGASSERKIWRENITSSYCIF